MMRKLVLVCMVLCFALLDRGVAMASKGVVVNGSVVTFDYVLKTEGELIDSSQGKEPLEFTAGSGMILPGLEKQLMGMRAGQKKTVSLPAAQAYGTVDERAVIEVPKGNLADEFNPQVGMYIQLTTEEGQPVPGRIIQVNTQTIVVDFNHPLAGRDLTFDISIVSVK